MTITHHPYPSPHHANTAGDMYLPVLVNSLVHVAVYLHYFLTCIGIQPFWSPYLTSFQVFIHAYISISVSIH